MLYVPDALVVLTAGVPRASDDRVSGLDAGDRFLPRREHARMMFGEYFVCLPACGGGCHYETKQNRFHDPLIRAASACVLWHPDKAFEFRRAPAHCSTQPPAWLVP